MKIKNRIKIFTLSLCAVMLLSSATAFATPDEVGGDQSTPVSSADPDNGGNIDGELSSTPSTDIGGDTGGDTSSSYVPDTSQSSESNDYNNNYYNNDDNSSYYDYSQDSTYSRSSEVIDRENEYYETGTQGEDSTQPVVDNKLYEAALGNDSAQMSADDWNLELDLDSANSGNDFSFIKDNESSEDSVWYQLMLFGGVLLITIAVFGICLVIILAVRDRKKNKARLAKAAAHNAVRVRSKEARSIEKLEEETITAIQSDRFFDIGSEKNLAGENNINESNIDEIDLSRFDKYLE